MEEPEQIISPRLSAFETLWAKVYPEMWMLQENPAAFTRRVLRFVRVEMPSILRDKLGSKLQDFDDKLDEMNKKINALRAMQAEADPLTEESIDRETIPAVEVGLTEEIWHAVIDVLTDAGLNIPFDRGTMFYDPSRGKKSGMSRHKGFPSKLPDVVS